MVTAWPTLDENSVQIWYTYLDQLANARLEAWEHLSIAEQERAARFHFELHRRRFVASHYFLRSILAAYLSLPAQQIQFRFAEYGKPALAQVTADLDLRFNLAHSENLAVVGLTLGQEVGVDVEYLKELRAPEQITRRFFSLSEQVEFNRLPANQKLVGFYHGWTRKEAFIKALGTGLAYPLADFDVTLTPGQPSSLLRVANTIDEASRWSLVSFQPGPDYIAALAIRKPQVNVVIHSYPSS